MALSSIIYNFEVHVSNVDRNVYESLSLRIARHPSETEEYLVTRLIAYCMEFADGISFSRGLSDPDEPAIAIRDLTGQMVAWIDVGAPDAKRVHKASKAAPRVAIYTHRDPAMLRNQWAGERIHRLAELELYEVDRSLVAAFVARLERRMTLDMSISDGHLYIATHNESLDGTVTRVANLA